MCLCPIVQSSRVISSDPKEAWILNLRQKEQNCKKNGLKHALENFLSKGPESCILGMKSWIVSVAAS